jgi:hypothetical protein
LQSIALRIHEHIGVGKLQDYSKQLNNLKPLYVCQDMVYPEPSMYKLTVSKTKNLNLVDQFNSSVVYTVDNKRIFNILYKRMYYSKYVIFG